MDGFRGVPGVPEGWELLGIGCEAGDWSIGFLDGKRCAVRLAIKVPNSPKIRKIEKPKRYRPFANAAEFKPHRDRWIRFASDDSSACWKVSWYRDDGVFLNHGPERRHLTFGLVFEEWTFDDGTPFGVEVTDGE